MENIKHGEIDCEQSTKKFVKNDDVCEFTTKEAVCEFTTNELVCELSTRDAVAELLINPNLKLLPKDFYESENFRKLTAIFKYVFYRNCTLFVYECFNLENKVLFD